jgi:hypothetical protein
MKNVMEDERVILTVEQATAMLPDRPRIHTFRQLISGELIGDEWDRDQVIDEIIKYGAELSGTAAASAGHGIVSEDSFGYLFIETTTNLSVDATADSGAVGGESQTDISR